LFSAGLEEDLNGIFDLDGSDDGGFGWFLDGRMISVVDGDSGMNRDEIQAKIEEILKSITIRPEYSTEVIRITDYEWNGKMDDFQVEYFIESTKYVFLYPERLNPELAAYEISDDRLEQLENEVIYVKRMITRGIGAKEYYPLTEVVKEWI
jgi:5-methylcytosine-specific restriction enzyme subunit McrC